LFRGKARCKRGGGKEVHPISPARKQYPALGKKEKRKKRRVGVVATPRDRHSSWGGKGRDKNSSFHSSGQKSRTTVENSGRRKRKKSLTIGPLPFVKGRETILHRGHSTQRREVLKKAPYPFNLLTPSLAQPPESKKEKKKLVFCVFERRTRSGREKLYALNRGSWREGEWFLLLGDTYLRGRRETRSHTLTERISSRWDIFKEKSALQPGQAEQRKKEGKDGAQTSCKPRMRAREKASISGLAVDGLGGGGKQSNLLPRERESSFTMEC